MLQQCPGGGYSRDNLPVEDLSMNMYPFRLGLAVVRLLTIEHLFNARFVAVGYEARGLATPWI